MAILDHKFDHIKFSPKAQSAELSWKILVIDDEKAIHDINDYLIKTDATNQRLQTLVKKSIRSFKTQSDLENELAHRKKIEQQLKEKLISQLGRAQRLEALGALAGGIAHDFNNILGGILGYAQLLQFELKNNQAGISYTNQIVSGCNRAKNLVLQILDFSRQRETISPPEITDPIKIVQKTINLLRASIPSSIKIHSDIAQDAGYILADPSQIHQAVMNLCTNARQAIENSMGKITISVQDTGKGIKIDTLEKIFNPYFTTKDRGDGTGLGLSVVHGIVTRFNGTQLAAKIKQINHLIPIVLATGFTNLVQTQKANPSGIDAILPKPITMNALSQTLHLLLVK